MKKLTYSILVFFLGILLVQAQQGEKIRPLDIAKIKTVGDVVLSDDGSTAAYTLNVYPDPLKENAPASSQLHLLDMESGESRPFLTRGSVSQVAFRPEHESITFLGRLGEETQTTLYEIALAGGEAIPLFSFETSIRSYEWAPNGKELAIIAPEKKEEKENKLPYQPEIYEENLTYARGYVVNVESEERQMIDIDGHVSVLHWSPDGNRLAVVSSPTPLVDDFYMHRSISIFDKNDLKSASATVDHQAKLGQLAWSPDSEHLAIIAGAHLNDPIDGRLMVVSKDGGKPKMLQPDYKGKFEAIEWADEETLHFLASEGVWTVLGSIQADGTGMKKLMDKEGPILHTFDRSDNGHYAFVADTPTHPSEVYVMKKGARDAERATDHNPWLKDRAMGRQESITYQAEDGTAIEGILIHPVNEEVGKKYPLVTVVHGGPESHYSNGWLTGYSSPGQLAAGRGMAVFYPNYRGSTGRGLAFAMSSQGDLAGKEFDDIVDGVDHLIEMGLVDEDKVGVTGGSYGGYATGWLCTKYTDRFAAGVMFVGISDNISKWGTSDIPEELYLVHARKRIWEDYEFFLERSPIYYAGQAETPLLIMAGKEDTRVHPSQSIELYRHIKTRTDTPVRLVLFPGEGHGNRNSTARYDYSLRMSSWFEQYLLDKPIKP